MKIRLPKNKLNIELRKKDMKEKTITIHSNSQISCFNNKIILKKLLRKNYCSSYTSIGILNSDQPFRIMATETSKPIQSTRISPQFSFLFSSSNIVEYGTSSYIFQLHISVACRWSWMKEKGFAQIKWFKLILWKLTVQLEYKFWYNISLQKKILI